ncbi:Pam17-domain-containing protein, partial [Hypoxylon sp. FL1284]
MLTPATTTARLSPLGARGLQLQAAVARGASCQYSSLAALSQRQCAARTAKPIASLKTQTQTQTQTQSIARRPVRTQYQLSSRRHASTAAPTAGAAPTGAAEPRAPPLDWNQFFTLRKTRRRFQLVSSLFTMAAGGTAGAVLLVNMDMEWLLSKVPMDPFFALGGITLVCSALGWLAGPSLGSALFYSFRGGVKRPMARKEAEFFARIKKNRVDPSNSSLSGNAVPDFYGEKISSVAGYRQW